MASLIEDRLHKARQIDFQPNWKGRGYDTYTFMAPINYKGRDYLGVIVTKDAQSSRYYVHEVVDADGNILFKNDENPAPASDGTSALSGDLDTVANAGALSASPSDGRASPEGTVDTVGTSSVEGTRPLNSNPTIAQGADSVKFTDPLMQAIFGGEQRVDQSTLSPEQFSRLAELNDQGVVGMDADGRVYQVDPEEHIDRRDSGTVGNRKLNAFQYDHPELAQYYQVAAQALAADLSQTERGGQIYSYPSD